MSSWHKPASLDHIDLLPPGVRRAAEPGPVTGPGPRAGLGTAAEPGRGPEQVAGPAFPVVMLPPPLPLVGREHRPAGLVGSYSRSEGRRRVDTVGVGKEKKKGRREEKGLAGPIMKLLLDIATKGATKLITRMVLGPSD